MSNIADKKKEKCIRRIINWSSIQITDRFDKPSFSKSKLLETLYYKSPKSIKLIDQINKLDKQDLKNNGKLYKHFIFSDISGSGSKILTSLLLSIGFKLALKHKRDKLIVDIPTNNHYKNFAVMSSTSMWNSTFNPKLIKDILFEFNKRPDNINGKNIRIIIGDSGFKEGVSLFDVKYVHIFEQQKNDSDLTQAIGRALRYCSHMGLPYIEDKGWGLNVYYYNDYTDKLFNNNTIMNVYNKNTVNFNNLNNEIYYLLKNSAMDRKLTEKIDPIVEYSQYKKNKKINIITIAGLTTSLLTLIYLIKKYNKKNEK